MLKIVHISSSRFGGAGKAAFRLHEGLLAEPNIMSTFITADQTINIDNPSLINIKSPKHQLHHRIASKCGFPILKFHKNIKLQAHLKGYHEMYSLPETDFVLENLKIIDDADIINLHWVSNFINYTAFFEAYGKKPIVWTLHDMNPFMGGFHYTNDFLNNPSFHALENALLIKKKENIQLVRNLNIVTPSRWLMKEAVKSNVFSHVKKKEVIPYSVDLNKFKPIDKNEAKGKLSINPKVPCLLVVAQNLTTYRKGFDLLIAALELLNQHDFQLLAVGNQKLNFNSNIKLIELGTITNDNILRTAYSAADIVIIPSREDNLPNVMLESFACGTPVISFKVGGMADWIIPNFNGLFSESLDAKGLREIIEKYLYSNNNFDSQKIGEFARSNLSPDIQARKYTSLYKSILNS